jgi:DNA-binding CsgD family transcriptional regulator
LDTKTTTALLTALRIAREHGGAGAALTAGGIDLRRAGPFAELPRELEESEALALGFLAGHVLQRPRVRTRRTIPDPTAFFMDSDLVVRGAEGESILRLPWFDEGLFVGRPFPDIYEIPKQVLKLGTANYSAALKGMRGDYAFTSYGHTFAVEVVPMTSEEGRVDGVLAVATPQRSHLSALAAFEGTADRLDKTATLAAKRAELHMRAGRADDALADRRIAESSRRAAERLRSNARGCADPPILTPREAEVLSLVSHGLSSPAIGEQLSISVATVRTHLQHVRGKLGATDKAAAVAVALRHGLID